MQKKVLVCSDHDIIHHQANADFKPSDAARCAAKLQKCYQATSKYKNKSIFNTNDGSCVSVRRFLLNICILTSFSIKNLQQNRAIKTDHHELW